MASPDVRTAVRHGAAHLERMAEELASLEAAGRVAEPPTPISSTSYEVLGGYTLDQRVDAALSGLGFTAEEVARPPTALSGGEQTRAALARLVIADPELLLLDEPTNHLDIGALEWLEEHLRRRAGSLLVASHDRAFLDATVTRVWELRDRRITAFRGDYSAYHRQREERDARAAKDAESHEGQIARERELVQRYRSHRKFSKMHEHEARLERLQTTEVEAPRATRRLRLPQAALRRRPARSGRGRGPGRRSRRRLPPRARQRRAAAAGRDGAVPRRPSRGADRDRGARTGRARRPSSGRSPATCRRSMAG